MLQAFTWGLIMLVATSASPADSVDSVNIEPNSNSSRWLWGVGLQHSSYKYEEPGLMETEGQFNRLNGFLSRQIDRLYLTGEFTVGMGNVDYFGSLSDGVGNTIPYEETNIPDRLYEFRFLLGQSFQNGSMEFIPAIGIGLRFLDDLGGDKLYFYDRHSRYTYVPLRMRLILPLSAEVHSSRLSLDVEYDYFIGGVQKTDLNDAGGSYISGDTLGVSYEDISSDQNGGSGARFALAWDLGTQPGKFNAQFSIYYESWRIDDSKQSYFERTIHMLDPADNVVDTFVGVEPANRTREIGITIRLSRF